MIIWDNINKEHVIRIKGKEKVRVKTIDFPLNANKEDNELAIKQKIDVVTSLSKYYHAHIHIFSKPTNLTPNEQLSYMLWLGPIGFEPFAPKNYKWWENWNEEE